MRNFTTLKPYIMLFAAGLNLILIQWVMVRELTTLLFGTELVILLVSAAYFAGISLGYMLSNRISRQILPALAVVTLILHITLPVWFRLMTITLHAVGAYALAFIMLPLLTVVIVPAFYSIFLPHLADKNAHLPLPMLYGIELLGSTLGVIALVLLGGLGVDVVFVFYAFALVMIFLALDMSTLLVAVLATGAGLWLIAFPEINAWSNSLFFQRLQGLPSGSVTRFTAYSPYQKVDVLETPNGDRYLFLDGLRHFGSDDGSRLNIIMGGIPAQLIRPESALVIGAGSMEMERLISDYAKHVTTIEIDPVVVDASLRYFDAVNRMSQLQNRSIIIDDAKHYIANTTQTFDLIATDTPAAITIQTATLYAQAFFEALKSRLTDDGLLVVNLTSAFDADSLIARRIMAGLLTTFDDALIVTAPTAGWSFAYAADHLPFTRDQLESALIANGENNPIIYTKSEAQAIVADATPITLDSMDIVLTVSVRRLARLWGIEVE